MTNELFGPAETRQQLISLLGEAGTDRFGESLSGLMQATQKVDYFVINLHDADYQLDERLGKLTRTQKEVASMVDRHATFRFDPNSELVNQLRNNQQTFYLNRVQYDSVRSKRFHDLFSQRFELIDRLSVISSRGSSWLVSSFYRTRSSGAFSDSELELFGSLGRLSNSLTDTHLRLRHLRQLGSGEREPVSRAVRRSLPMLSDRESQVACLLFCGLDNSAAAKQLEVSVETVRTLRRRIREKTGCGDLASLLEKAMAWAN